MYRIFPAAVLLVLICELFVLDYPSLWRRESPTRNQVATEYYNDGTKEAVAMLKEQDDSVYRIEKSYTSASENDGMSQGYNGLSVYMSTNPASLVAYHKMYGPETLSGNFVDFNMDDYIRSSLLGTKYLITGTGYHAPQKIYTSVGEAGGRSVFENQYALPFGYLYDKEWNQEEVKRNVRTGQNTGFSVWLLLYGCRGDVFLSEGGPSGANRPVAAGLCGYSD